MLCVREGLWLALGLCVPVCDDDCECVRLCDGDCVSVSLGVCDVVLLGVWLCEAEPVSVADAVAEGVPDWLVVVV